MRIVPSVPTEPSLTKREVADVLGVSLSTVNRLIADGTLIGRPIGGNVRPAMLVFRRADVERLAARRGAA